MIDSIPVLATSVALEVAERVQMGLRELHDSGVVLLVRLLYVLRLVLEDQFVQTNGPRKGLISHAHDVSLDF